MTIQIRAVGPEDVVEIAALARVVWQHAYPAIITQAQIDYMLEERYNTGHLLGELAQPGLWWDQAFIDGQRVGFSSCYLTETSGELKLDKLYVHPEQQRSGIGAALIGHVMAHGRDNGCHTVMLAVNKRNSKAIVAYEKRGFAIRDSVRVDIGNGFVMDDFIMARSIR